MGFFKKVGKAFSKPVHFATAAGGAIVGGVTGGPLGVAAGWKAGDKIGNIQEDTLAGRSVKKNLKNNLFGAATAGAEAYGASTTPHYGDGGKIMNFSSGSPKGKTKLPDWRTLIKDPISRDGKSGGLGGYQIPGPDDEGGGILDRITGAVKNVRKATGGNPITLQNTLGRVKGGLGVLARSAFDNPGQTAQYALAGAAGINAAKAYKRAGDYRNKGISLAEKSYADKAPLRAQGMAGLTNRTPVDTSDLATDVANPFARKRKITLPGAA